MTPPASPIDSRQVLAAEALLRALDGQAKMPLRQALQLAPAGCAQAEDLLGLLRGLGVRAEADGQNLVLDRPLRLLDGERLAADLEGALGGDGIEVDLGLCLSTSSTNTDVAAWLERPPGPGKSVLRLAEHQSGGRGRRGRGWSSPLAAHIYMSAGQLLPASQPLAQGLSLAVGVVAVRALREHGVQGLGLKWPNDIHRAGRKLGGVLVEVTGDAEHHRVVVGVGLNCRMPPDFAPDTPWADLADLHGGDGPDRTGLAASLGAGLVRLLAQWREPGFAGWQQEWNGLHQYRDVPVRIERGGQEELRGLARGADPSGALLLETEAGVVRVLSGEVSLRPLSEEGQEGGLEDGPQGREG